MLYEHVPFAKQFLRIVLTTAAIMCLSVLVVTLLSVLVAGRYSRRMNTLIHKMSLVRHGNLSASEPALRGSDELAVLDEQFDYMVRRLKDTIDHGYVLELEKKDAQLRAMQLQINPHFLYNTLESLSVIALIRGQSDVSDALEKLGRLFRYGVTRESREQVTVREEIAHVANYVSLQQMRFPDQIDVFFNIPAELNECRMPFFILQPIVENAILHGLRGGSHAGAIEVSASRDADDLCLCVEDDGAGMSREQCEALQDKIGHFSYDATNSIGLQNVHARLRLMYGERYGLTIESALKRGTGVLVRMPILQSGEEDGHASPDIAG